MPTRERWIFRVEGLRSVKCGLRIDEALFRIDGVREALTSSRSGLSIIEIESGLCTPDDLMIAIAAAGYRARLDSEG